MKNTLPTKYDVLAQELIQASEQLSELVVNYHNAMPTKKSATILDVMESINNVADELILEKLNQK